MKRLLIGIMVLVSNFADAGDWADFAFVNKSDHPIHIHLANGYGQLNWWNPKYKDKVTLLAPNERIEIGRLETSHNCNYTDRKQDELLVRVYDDALPVKLPYNGSEHPAGDLRYWGSAVLHVNLATPDIGVVGCEYNDDHVQVHTINEVFGGHFRVYSNITGWHWGETGLNFDEQPGGEQRYEIDYMACDGTTENSTQSRCVE